MKRIVFRLAVAMLTFFVGVASTKFPSSTIHTPKAFKTAGQDPSIPETKQQPQPVISDTLQKIGDLPEPFDEYGLVSLQFINEAQGWLAQGQKLWRTKDGGKNWKVVFTPKSGGDGRDGWMGRFQFINSRTGWLVSDNNLYKTDDGGNSWKIFDQPIACNYDDGLPVGLSNFTFLKDGKRGWVVGDTYRALSRKERETGEYPHPRYSSVDGQKVLTSLIYYTKDGGQSWTQQPLLSGWYDIGEIYALDDRHAWAVGLAGVYYLQNGKWRPVKSDEEDANGNMLVNSLGVAIGAPTDSPCSIYFVNPHVGWLVNSNGYLGKSADGGRTWRDVSTEFGSEQFKLSRWDSKVYFTDPMKGWGLDGNGKLIETTDGGESWSKVDENIAFAEMYFLDARRGWAISKEGLFRIDAKRPADSSEAAKQASSMNVDYYAHLKPKHREVVREWLKTRTYLRPAVEEIDNNIFQERGKPDFEANLKFLRDSLGENNNQYYSVGDMSRDGKEDFAILLVDGRKQKDDPDHFALAIFNAPFKKASVPAYYEDGLSGISNCYIVFDHVSKNHLFLSLLESDVLCATYYPKGKTYYFKDCVE